MYNLAIKLKFEVRPLLVKVLSFELGF